MAWQVRLGSAGQCNISSGVLKVRQARQVWCGQGGVVGRGLVWRGRHGEVGYGSSGCTPGVAWQARYRGAWPCKYGSADSDMARQAWRGAAGRRYLW